MKKLLVGVTVATMMLAMAGCSESITENEKSEIDLNDYVVYEFSGYDGDGVISYSIDYEAIIDQNEALADCRVSKLERNIHGSWNQTDSLSNGDTVVFEWTNTLRDLENDYEVSFSDEDLEITVDGLEIKPDFDPFEYFEIEYTGISPEGQAVAYTASTPVGDVYYTLSADYGLSNGDTITVTAMSYDGELAAVADEENYTLTRDTMDVTVEGLDEYVSSIDDIPEDIMNTMQEQGLNVFYSEISWDESEESLISVDYDGMYFLYTRNNDSGYYNQCYMIYKVCANNVNVGDFEFYYYVSFNNLIKYNDGTVTVNTSEYNCPVGHMWVPGTVNGESFFFEEDYYHFYVGYLEFADLYANVIQNQLVDYECASTYEG